MGKAEQHLEFDDRVWDREIKADVKAGKLDGLVAWDLYRALPAEGRELAEKSFTLLVSAERVSEPT